MYNFGMPSGGMNQMNPFMMGGQGGFNQFMMGGQGGGFNPFMFQGNQGMPMMNGFPMYGQGMQQEMQQDPWQLQGRMGPMQPQLQQQMQPQLQMQQQIQPQMQTLSNPIRPQPDSLPYQPGKPKPDGLPYQPSFPRPGLPPGLDSWNV